MEKYEKIRVVGRGAYGTVYLCRQLFDNKLVIIKQIPVEQMTRDERQSALNEVVVLNMLNHPNIIQYYENFLEDKALMIVMEYAEGGTVFDYLQQCNGRLLNEEEILKFFTQMLLSLQHVHSKQILHRDLKTQNILLDKKKEVVKIGDFGISKILSSKTKAFTVVGTPCYISPELCEGKPYNQKSDIWALGCVLYELATLQRAFEAQNLPALILKIMRGTVSPISDQYSDDLKQLVLMMLHLDPNNRPTINQIMAQPIILNYLVNQFTDFGKIPCTKVMRPLSALPGAARSGPTGTQGRESDCLSKPLALSTVYCWGNGITVPVRLPLPNNDTQVAQVSAGRTQKATVTRNGRLLLWETSSSFVDGSTNEAGSVSFIPRYLEGQSAVSIQHVSCGDLFAACLTDRGILMTLGSGTNGCLGHGNFADVTQAKIVESLLGYEVVKVACGTSHVLAITNDNEVFAWGRGENGRLGLGNQQSHCTPQQVPIPEGFKLSLVSCGVDGSMLLAQNSTLLCCGSNRYNKLSLDPGPGKQVDDVNIFTVVNSYPLSELPIKTVAMGTTHSAVVTDTGECYCFGSNQFGQLGCKKQSDSRSPSRVDGLDKYHISYVDCGDTFTIAASKDGKVLSWGKNSRGRLGREDKYQSRLVNFTDEVPFEVLSLSSSHGLTLLATKPRLNKDMNT